MMKFLLFSAAALSAFADPGLAEGVRYELVIRNEPVDLSGKKTVDFALTVNGGIPAPVLEFTEGDEAEILVRNGLRDEEVSIHWHGLLLPPEEDGVPYVNTPPIHPGAFRVFRFKLRQSGTYWYHSHTAVQEQKGVYGAFVVHPRKRTIAYDREAVLVLSDWSDENADRILRNLRKDGDYYLYKKDSIRSYAGAIRAGSLKSQLRNEWTRMGGMDLSDVGYDAFLINGKRDSQLLAARPGERIRLRIVNAAASSYFHVSLAGLPMSVISADGVDIDPVEAREILMGMAETYDVLFTMPERRNYEFRATAQDGTGQASAWIGAGEKAPAPDRPRPDPYASMEHGAHGDDGARSVHGAGHGSGHGSGHGTDHSRMGHAERGASSPAAPVIQSLTVDSLRAIAPTAFPEGAKVHEVKLVLGGDMERYVWHLNGKAVHEDRLILIDQGEVVRFTFVNDTMMHHPMHLHGHFFRVLNRSGDRSPLKHTVDVPPHRTRTVEFLANEPGQWMLHCHNLYHLKTGMARVVRYRDYPLTPEMRKHDRHDPHLHDHLYAYSMLELATHHAQANFKLMRTWDELDLRLESAEVNGRSFRFGKDWATEGDLVYRRWFSNWLNAFGGGTLYHGEGYGAAGVGYTLPLLIESAISVNHAGEFRFDLGKRFQWTKTLFTDAEFTWRPDWGGERDREFEISLMYAPAWAWAAGLMATEESLGAGVQVRF